jgi:hypothetical protein
VVMLLGNKTDLAEDDEHRVVKEKDGTRLADVSCTSFLSDNLYTSLTL